MSVLLVGGDRLGNITERLMEYGFDNVEHISGRKHGHRRLKIPVKTDLVVILVDYVEHELTEIMKRESKKNDIEIAFSKRSWTYMEKIIKSYTERTLNDKRNFI